MPLMPDSIIDVSDVPYSRDAEDPCHNGTIPWIFLVCYFLFMVKVST